MLATLYVCRKKGLLLGIGTGALLGVAYSPLLTPSFLLAALAAGALFKVSSIFACSAAFGIGTAISLYTNGIAALTSFMPAMLASCLLFAVIDKTFLRESKISDESAEKAKNTEVQINNNTEIAIDLLTETRLSASVERQKMLCETFSSMSDFFCELGEKMKTPLVCDTKNICDSAFDSSCASCRCKPICNEERYAQTVSAVNSISAALHRSGKISVNDAPASLRRFVGIIDRFERLSVRKHREALFYPAPCL